VARDGEKFTIHARYCGSLHILITYLTLNVI